MNRLAAALALASCCALGCASDEFEWSPIGEFELCFASPPPPAELEFSLVSLSGSIVSESPSRFLHEQSVSGQLVLENEGVVHSGVTHYVVLGKYREGPWTVWPVKVAYWPDYGKWSDWQPAWKVFRARNPSMALLYGEESVSETPPAGGPQMRFRVDEPPLSLEESEKLREAKAKVPPEQRKTYTRADFPIPACGP